MKLIRWLLSNIILIAFVLALTYAYVYWDNLTGEETPAGKAIAYLSVEYDEVREFLDSYDFDGGESAIEVAEPAAPLRETASVPQVMPPPRPQPIQPPVQQPAQRPVQALPPQAMVQQAPPVQPSLPPQAVQPMRQPPAAQPMRQVPAPMPPVRPVAPPVQAPAEPAVKSAEAAPSARELWISAREEYHRGNIDASISNYRQVIAGTKDNYDAYGELGNVYLSRGNYREAANAYFEAAAILVRLGETGRARSLLPMLGRLDRSRADELHQLIHAPRS